MPESSVALDRLALKCRGGDESALAALLESLRPSVRKMASRAARRAANCGLTIPAEDFESMFGEAVWEACQGYDGSTSYVRRLSVFLKRAEADVWRQYRNLQNGRPKYTAASMWSLDAMLSTERDAPCDMNFAFAFSPGPEEDTISRLTVMQAIEEFSKVDRVNGPIIRLLASGVT